MQAPMTFGSLLQNRYRIMQTLTEGKFGRTYLAEDERRFNELCAIKELIAATGNDAGEKAQELFQQEAAILYQVEHPQVPQFREKFQEEERLFLVEDYVAGKSYQSLLSERLAAGTIFTEAEVLQLIRSLLPVLEHIHSRGIIHRNISPDNIILRDRDRQPVLINFAIVQELATRLQSPDTTTPVSIVGNVGFAPSEQIESGLAYPHSDLYALAVTAIVLLTGKQPSDLFEPSQGAWNWEQWVKVTPEFAPIITKMLNHLPGDRFQCAADVMAALNKLEPPHPTFTELSPASTHTEVLSPEPEPIISNHSSSILDRPLILVAIGIIIVIFTGVSSWSLVSFLRSEPTAEAPEEIPPLPQTFPSPIVTGEETPSLEESTPSPTASPTPQISLRAPVTEKIIPSPTPPSVDPVIFSQRLSLNPSEPTTIEDTIGYNQIIQYRFFGEKGATLTASIDPGSGISLTILDNNQKPVDSNAEKVKTYQGILPNSGTYIIQLTAKPEIAASDYILNVSLENPVIPTPTETPVEETPTESLEETPPRETLEETPFFTPGLPPIPQPDFNFSNDTPSPKPSES
jgi:serine/threonine protein kinase